MPLRRILLPAVFLVLPAWSALLRAGESADDPPRIQFSPAHVRELARAAEIGSHANRIEALRELAHYRSAASPVAGRVRKLLDDPAADISRAASDTLYAMGGAATPQWLDALRSRDGFTRRLAVTALADPWLNKFADREVLLRRLLPVLRDPDPLIRQPAALALLALWPESEPALTGAMKAGDNLVKQVVIEQLLEKGGNLAESSPPLPIDETAVDFEAQVFAHLLRRMKSPIQGERDRAFEVLGRFRSREPRRKLAIFLVLALEDERPSIFLDAAKKLKRLGSEAVPALVSGTRSKDAWVRKICVEGLAGRIESMNDEKDERDEKAVAAMTTALGDPNDEVRRHALIWAENLHEAPPGAVEKLAAWMSPGNSAFNYMYPNDRARGAAVLGQWAVEPKTSVPALIHALDDVYGRNVQRAATRALRQFGTDAVPAAPQLLQFLKQEDHELASAAAETLTMLGLEIHGAVASFMTGEHRGDREISARRMALPDLTSIGADAPSAVATLGSLLLDTRNDPRICVEVVHALGAIGPGASSAAAGLTALLSDTHNDLRIEVARALGEIGPGAQAALPGLTRMADNSDEDVRHAASEALLKISPAGEGLGPALIAAVMNRDRVWAVRLAWVLQRSASAPALRVRLAELATDDPDAGVRAAARRAGEVLTVFQ